MPMHTLTTQYCNIGRAFALRKRGPPPREASAASARHAVQGPPGATPRLPAAQPAARGVAPPHCRLRREQVL